MSPTLFRYKNYRFFFFSREETRPHAHVSSSDGEVKFWLEPVVSLAQRYNLSEKQLKELKELVEERKHAIKSAWKRHFAC